MNVLTKRVINLIKGSKLPIAKNWIHKTIESHPDFPSLLCIYETLNLAGIKCIIHQKEKQNIKNISLPTLFHLSTDDIELITKEAQITNTILEQWTGVLLNIDFVKSKITIPYLKALEEQKKKTTFSNIAYSIAATCLFILTFLNPTFEKIALFCSSIIGVLISYQLFLKEKGNSPKWVNSFCSSLGNGCDKVLSTSLSKGFYGITLADISMLYFLLIISLQLFYPNPTLTYLILFAAFPTTLISLFYQRFIVKSWCALCLSVSAIIWVQLAFVLLKGFVLTSITAKSTVTFLLCIFLTLIWFLLKRAIENYYKSETEQIKFLKKNRNPSVFNFLLEQQEKIEDVIWEDNMTFNLSSSTKINICIVCQPFCKPCAKAHNQLQEIMEIFPNDISLTIKWLSNSNKSKEAVQLLFYAAKTKKEKGGFQEIEDWFKIMDYEKFKKSLNIDDAVMTNTTLFIEEHNKWVIENSIEFTPTIFINKFKMPADYDFEDLKVILPSMIEGVNQIKTSNILITKDC